MKTGKDWSPLLIHALHVAHEEYFCKPYKEAKRDETLSTQLTQHYQPLPPVIVNGEIQKIELEEIVIQRPNHSLANAMRKALLVPAITQAYQFPASDLQLVMMQLAMIFESTGREHEEGGPEWQDDSERHRQASIGNFQAFAGRPEVMRFFGSEDEPSAVITEVAQALSDMYQPNPPPMVRILEVAHQLDLFRCKEQEYMDEKLKAISQETTEEACQALSMMALDAMRETGDRILSKHSAWDGELQKGYDMGVFANVSTIPSLSGTLFLDGLDMHRLLRSRLAQTLLQVPDDVPDKEKPPDYPPMVKEPAEWDWNGEKSEHSEHLFVVSKDSLEFQMVECRLKSSLDRAKLVRLWRVQHRKAWGNFDAKRHQITGEQWAWNSPSDADPLEIVNSEEHLFSSAYARTEGSYGRGLYFAKHAIYSDQFLPCRASKVKVHEADLPEKDQDILVGKDFSTHPDEVSDDDVRAVWNVEQVGPPVLKREECQLTRLRWNKAEAKKVLSEQVDLKRTKWQPADVKYIFLARVALGACKDYGSKCAENLRQAPPGYQSWSGTENDCCTKQLQERAQYEEYKIDCEQVMSNGARNGRQYIVDFNCSSYTYPAYLLEYESTRTRPKVEAAGTESRKRARSS